MERNIPRPEEVALAVHGKRLLALKGVMIAFTDTKIRNGKDTGIPCVTVGVARKYPKDQVAVFGLDMVPDALRISVGDLRGTDERDVLTDVIEVHALRAPPPDSAKPKIPIKLENQGKFRPKVPGGVSAIVCGSTACTVTLWVLSRLLGKPVMLNNGHCSVLSACSRKIIIQPSPYDLGIDPSDCVARFLAGGIDNEETDTAIHEGGKWDNGFIPSDEFATQTILHHGSWLGARNVEVGKSFEGTGRTSGDFSGTVLAIDGVANIQYPDKVRTKSNLIVTTACLQGGDSSSPMIDPETDEFLGQGFAGSDQISLFIKPESILRDPAIAPYQLDFSYKFEEPEEHECPDGQHWDEEKEQCVPDDENGNGDLDCYQQFEKDLIGWDGYDLNYLFEKIFELLMCLFAQGNVLSKEHQLFQYREKLKIIAEKIRASQRKDQLEPVPVVMRKSDWRGLFALSTLFICAIFGALSMWFAAAMSIFTFFAGMTSRDIAQYFFSKSKNDQ